MRNAMLGNAASGKHRPSFKMVSNMVIQLLHSIKYSVEVPFSNMAPQPPEIQKSQAKAKVSTKLTEGSIALYCPTGLTLDPLLNFSLLLDSLLFFSSYGIFPILSYFLQLSSKLSDCSAADWTL